RKDLTGARQWLDWALDARPPASPGAQGKPLAEPFAALWSRGAGEESEMRCAAAALLGESVGGQALPLLQACRGTGPSPPRRAAADLAPARAYLGTRRQPELLATVRRLETELPDSESGFGLEVDTLAALGRWDEVKAAAEQRLGRAGDDPKALGALALAAEGRGDYDEAEKLLRRLVESGRAGAADLNTLAWLLLVRGRAGDEAIELAQRANGQLAYKSHASLHTLAALYAEVGKTAEAYKVILQALDT